MALRQLPGNQLGHRGVELDRIDRQAREFDLVCNALQELLEGVETELFQDCGGGFLGRPENVERKESFVGCRRLFRFSDGGSTGLNSGLAGFLGDHDLSKSLSRSSWVTLAGRMELNRVRLTVSNSSTLSRLSSGSTSEACVSITGNVAISSSDAGEASDSPQAPQK